MAVPEPMTAAALRGLVGRDVTGRFPVGPAPAPVLVPRPAAPCALSPRRAANCRATRGMPALKAATAVRCNDRPLPGCDEAAWELAALPRGAGAALRGRDPLPLSPEAPG